jgi:RNA polymerase sigma-70 factor (ECF subfamily)
MDQTRPDRHLNQISTSWTVVLRALRGGGAPAQAAREQLLDRYGGAARRYLLGAVRDPDAAEDLFQEFAVCFLNGDLRGADRSRGRFRDFLRGVLFHLARGHQKVVKRSPQPLPSGYPAPANGPSSCSGPDSDFLTSWRDELLARAWEALAEYERRTGRPFHTVLCFRRDNPAVRSPAMAEQLAGRLGRRLTPAAVRQLLHRARERFAGLLLEEVAGSLEGPTDEQLEQLLLELRLFKYCRPALRRRARSEKAGDVRHPEG